MGTEEAEASKLAGCNQRYVDSLLRYQVISSTGQALPAFFLSLSSVIVLLYGGHLVINGQMTLGALVAFSAYQGRLIGPIQNVMGLYLGIQRAGVSLERVFELLDQKPYVKEAIHRISLSHVRGEVEFRGISFNYEPGQETLHDINLLVPAGSRLAIIGPYGRRKDYGHWSYCCAFTTLSKDRFCGMFTICANLSSKPCAKTSQLSLTSPVFFMASLRRIFEMETGTRRLRIFMRLHGLPTFTSSFCRFRKAIKRSSEREESGSPRDSDKELQSPERF